MAPWRELRREFMQSLAAHEPSTKMPGTIDFDDGAGSRKSSILDSPAHVVSPQSSMTLRDTKDAPVVTVDQPTTDETKGAPVHRAVPEVLVIVHPNPKKQQHHPYNLQVQLVHNKRPKTDSESSHNSDAEDAELHHRRKRASSFSSQQSVHSSASESSSSSSAYGRRTIALYNLDYHHIRSTQVLDAGTDQHVAKFTKKGIELVDFGLLEPHDISIHTSHSPESNAAPLPMHDSDVEHDSDSHGHEWHEDDATSHRGGPRLLTKMKHIGTQLRAKHPSPTRLGPSSASLHRSGSVRSNVSTAYPESLPEENEASITVRPPSMTMPRSPIPQAIPCGGVSHSKVTTSYVWEIKHLNRSHKHRNEAMYEQMLRKIIRDVNADSHTLVELASRAILERIWVQFNPKGRSGKAVAPPPAKHIVVWVEWVREWNGGLDNTQNVYDPFQYMHHASPSSAAGSPLLRPHDANTGITDPALDVHAADHEPGKGSTTLTQFQYVSQYPRTESKDPSEALWTCYLVLDGDTRVPLGRMLPAPNHPLVVSELLLPSPMPDLSCSGLGPDGKGFTREELRDIVTTTALHMVLREAIGCLNCMVKHRH